MAIIKKSTKNKCWRGCGEKRTLLQCKLVQPLWRTVWKFLKKINTELPYDSAIPLLGIYPEKTIIWKDTCTPLFTAALFAIGKIWMQPKHPVTEEWIKKISYIHTMGYYSAIKRDEIGLPWWLSGKESACWYRRHRFDPQSRKSPHAVENLSPCATATESVLYSPGAAATGHRFCSYWRLHA